MSSRALLAALAATGAAAGVGACGSDSDPTSETVVANASLAGAAPRVLAVTPTTVFWSAAQGSTTLVGAASLTSLPAPGGQIATSAGPVAPAGEHVVVIEDGLISRVDPDGTARRIVSGMPDAVAGSSAEPPVLAWSTAATLAWGIDDVQMSIDLTKVDACDHLYVTPRRILVAADGATGRRVLSVDQRTGDATPITSSDAWASMFPDGPRPSSTYAGRIVGGDDDEVLWLVEETPSRRAILISHSATREPTVLLQYITGATAFFTTDDALYWQEDDALLTAPRAGGAASIAANLPGAAGAISGGFIYFTNGSAIERMRVE